MNKNIRKYENFHILLWLVKDAAWVSHFRTLGMLMIIPTLVIAVDIAWRSRKRLHDIFHNAAICCWIAANATWMTGEFYFNDGTRPFAKIFFGLGLCLISYYYIFLRNRPDDIEE